MDTLMLGFNSMQIPANFGYNLPVLDPLNMPISPMPYDDIDLIDIYTFHPQPINMQMMDANLTPVTDIFGFTRICDPMSVDIMSGLPADAFPQASAQVMHEQNQAKLAENSYLEHERDHAVDKYHDAMNSGNYDEAQKWEHIANSHQQDLYNLWDTPNYSGLPAVAPGIRN